MMRVLLVLVLVWLWALQGPEVPGAEEARALVVWAWSVVVGAFVGD